MPKYYDELASLYVLLGTRHTNDWYLNNHQIVLSCQPKRAKAFCCGEMMNDDDDKDKEGFKFHHESRNLLVFGLVAIMCGVGI